jgi:hypothetical protein
MATSSPPADCFESGVGYNYGEYLGMFFTFFGTTKNDIKIKRRYGALKSTVDVYLVGN